MNACRINFKIRHKVSPRKHDGVYSRSKCAQSYDRHVCLILTLVYESIVFDVYTLLSSFLLYSPVRAYVHI